MSTKALLIHPHTYFTDHSAQRKTEVTPVGLAIVNGILRAHKVETFVIDIQALNLTLHQVLQVLESLSKLEFDAILISAMSTQYAYVKWLASRCKSLWKKTPIIVGGCLAHYNYEILLTKSKVDLAVLGEAEASLPQLIRNNFNDLTDIPGLAYKTDSAFVDNSLNRSIHTYNDTSITAHDILEINLEDSINQYFMSYEGIDISKYTFNVGGMAVGSIMSARGCLYNCNFCSKQFNSFRMHPIEFIERQIVQLKAELRGFGHVLFLDEFAIVNAKRAADISGIMKKYGLKWMANGRVNTFNTEIAKIIKEAGCDLVIFGIESGSDKILKNMNKKQTAQQIRTAINTALEHGIDVNPLMIIGYPGEDETTLNDTLKLYAGFDRRVRNAGFGFITPLPGSLLYNEMLQSGTIRDEEKYILSLEGGFNKIRINFTDWDDATLKHMCDKYTALINRSLGRDYNPQHISN